LAFLGFGGAEKPRKANQSQRKPRVAQKRQRDASRSSYGRESVRQCPQMSTFDYASPRGRGGGARAVWSVDIGESRCSRGEGWAKRGKAHERVRKGMKTGEGRSPQLMPVR
jgi:hypothetical protein